MPPLVSIVIPTYNRTSILPRTIKSVLEQTQQNFEIWVVDDGSTEDIDSVLKALHDARIRYLRLPQHTNANVARNAGIRAAKGEYIAMLDSDDEWLPQHLERRLQKIAEWGCDGIHGSFILQDGFRPRPIIARPRRLDESMVDYVLLTGNWTVTTSHFYRREAALAVAWDESLERHQDYDYAIRFGSQYDFRCDLEPTILMHWEKGWKSRFHFAARRRFYEQIRAQLSPNVAIEYLHSQLYQAVSSREPATTLAYYTGQLRSFRCAINARFEFFLSQHPHCYYWWMNHPHWRLAILALRRWLSPRHSRRAV